MSLQLNASASALAVQAKVYVKASVGALSDSQTVSLTLVSPLREGFDHEPAIAVEPVTAADDSLTADHARVRL
jgi:hypothetical protein